MNSVTSDINARLGAVVARYFQAKERNEPVDTEALLREYPDLTDDLRSFFAAQSDVARAAAPLKQAYDPNTATVGAETTAGPTVLKYFGDYEILDEIARGGMGVVYRARQVSLNRTVAIKMILAGQLASAGDVARFKVEAEAAANLDHPNILPIYEVGEHQGQHYFSMKLIAGGSLTERTAEAKANPKKAVATLVEICRAVDYAHRRGILHRDLKPANVLLDADGTPYVTDFGLAKKFEGDSGITQSGAIVGTPSYMAPEQAKGEKQLTTAADVYSLGAILYEMLTGRPPFRAESVFQTIHHVIEKEPDNPKALNPKADRDLSVIALKCLEKAPGKRYESAAALAGDLDCWLVGEPISARQANLAEVAWTWFRRNGAATACIIALGLVVGLTCVLAMLAAVPADPFLLPLEISPLHPVGWIKLVRHAPAFRVATIALAVILFLGAGWFVRLAARPRTDRAAMLAAAGAGLIATLMAFSILGPQLANLASRRQAWKIHPVEDKMEFAEFGRVREHLTPEETRYLEQYIPPERQFSTPRDRQKKIDGLYNQAIEANRFYSSVGVGWMVLMLLLVAFVGLSLESTWAAGHVVQSGRGPLARLACYFEMYLPASALTLWIPIAFVNWATSFGERTEDRPAYAYWIAPTLLGFGFVYLTHTSVIHRRNPYMRIGIYIGYALLSAGLVFLLSEL